MGNGGGQGEGVLLPVVLCVSSCAVFVGQRNCALGVMLFNGLCVARGKLCKSSELKFCFSCQQYAIVCQ